MLKTRTGTRTHKGKQDHETLLCCINHHAGPGSGGQCANNRSNGKANDGTSTASPGRQVHLWGVNRNHPNQQWIELSRGDYFSYQRMNTSLCLDGGNGAAKRQPVVLQVCNANNQNQQWDKIGLSNGTFRLEKRNTNFSIDGNNGAERGQDIYLWNSSDSNVNQQWRFLREGSEVVIV